MAKHKKWVVQKSMHLGMIKTGVAVGTIIIHDEEHNKLIIDGKLYEQTKDLEIMIKHKWVTPFEDTKARAAAEKAQVEQAKRIETHEKETKKNSTDMPIVRSDADDIADIDISYTKKAPALPREKNADMPVVRGDESPEERVKRMQAEIPVLEVVRDDSLGTNIADSITPTGIKHRTAEEHAKMREEALKKAQKGFVDPRIAEAQKAVDSIPAPAEKRGRGRPKKATVAAVVAGTSPKLPTIEE
jgi:hypothetical protein